MPNPSTRIPATHVMSWAGTICRTMTDSSWFFPSSLSRGTNIVEYAGSTNWRWRYVLVEARFGLAVSLSALGFCHGQRHDITHHQYPLAGNMTPLPDQCSLLGPDLLG